MYTQLTLDLQLRESHTFENFVVGDNALLLQLLQQATDAKGEKQLFIWGEQFIGKSHLLQAVCQLANEKNFTVSYLPFKQVIDYTSEVLDGLEQIDLVCIDDLQLVANKPVWQEKIFDLINRMREANKCLLFAANLPPNELTLQLEDLRSRLNWGPVIKVNDLNDHEKQQALQLRARSRGFELPDQVASFMLNNYARDLSGLFEKLEALDKISLQQQRRLTVPFVKTALK
ncbi:MAG: DnaA regulatory inactivator Hda [Gammaproteobacteria bacterium]|nr:DnaA regulatory inactivator Hda [Gammaproteobacteria bacterium]